MTSMLDDSLSHFTPAAVCAGCGARITPLQDWKTTPDGDGYLHRACEAAK